MNLIEIRPPERTVNVIDLLVNDKRSANTKRAYRRDLQEFFTNVAGDCSPETVRDFLQLPRLQAVAVVIQYKAALIEKGLAESTVNRRLAALRSLVSYARKVDLCSYDLSDVEGEKVKSYRDTSGPTTEQVVAILSVPDRSTVRGKRDYAILRLLWSNALRRGEIVSCNVRDFDEGAGTLAILGKGRGTQKELVSIQGKTADALTDWLKARNGKPGEPLFTALDNNSKGHRLTGESIYYITLTAARAAGVSKKVTPHRMRHSSITAALEATGGDVARVQRLSRHAKVETLMIYNDHRQNHQGEVTSLLEQLA